MIDHPCSDYDPIYSGGGPSGGPCWTCQDDPRHCPLEQTLRSARWWGRATAVLMIGCVIGLLACLTLTICMIFHWIETVTWVTWYTIALAFTIGLWYLSMRLINKTKELLNLKGISDARKPKGTK